MFAPKKGENLNTGKEYCQGSGSGYDEQLVFLVKTTGGGDFDSTAYNQTSYNRGWITIWYEP